MIKNSLNYKKNLILNIISAEPLAYGSGATGVQANSTVKFAFHEGDTVSDNGAQGELIFNTGLGKSSGIITVGGKIVSSKILDVSTSQKANASTGVKTVTVSYVDEDLAIQSTNFEIVDSSAVNGWLTALETEFNTKITNIDSSINTIEETLNNLDLDGAVMEDNYVTEYEIGGLAKNTSIGGKNAVEVLDMILKPEYAPTFNDATCSISCSAYSTSGTYVEVGTNTPALSTFSNSGSKASTGNCGSNVAYGGALNSSSYTIKTTTAGATTYDVSTLNSGQFVVTATRNYLVGTDVVKTSKGTVTNKTAANTTTLLVNATANTNIDSSNHIKALQKTADFTINYGYKVYASTVTDGVLTDQGVISQATFNTSVTPTGGSKIVYGLAKTLKGGTGKQKFALPASYTNVKFYQKNKSSLTEPWNETTNAWSTEASTHTLPSGATKAYVIYTCDNVNLEDSDYSVTATIKD